MEIKLTGKADLKKKTAYGLVYKLAERVGAQGISLIIQIILARLLMPQDYGAVALVIVFITVCDVLVTYGFGNSLIINQKSDQTDFSTCFYFGLVLSLFVYFLIFIFAPYIAQYYNIPVLTPVIRVMGLRVFIGAINSVQCAYVQKHMWFKKFFYATLTGTLLSGIIAVFMAYMGYGIWALVEQYFGNVLIGTICLWTTVKWRPTRDFSLKRLKVIYSYGWKILAVGLIDTLYGQLRYLIIGKKYSGEALAYYNRGYSYPSFSMRLVESTVNAVLFPALTQCQDDQTQMRDITRKVIMASTFIIFPVMVGLAVVAKPLVLVLLTEKWLSCVIYLQIGCLANLFRPNQFINNCVVRASGNSGLLLKLDILKKAIGLVILLISMNYGMFWIAFSLVFVYFISMIINIAPNRIILNYDYKAQAKDFIKNLIPAFVMGTCVYPISLLSLRPIITLVVQIIAGVLVYWFVAVVTKNESYRTFLGFAKQILNRHSKDEN